MTFIILSTGVVSIITRNLQGNTIDLLDAQEELENAQKNLERNYNELQSAAFQIQSEKDKTATILSHLADGVLVFDADKRLMYANPQAVKYINNIDADEDWITDSTLGELGSTQNMQHIFRLVEESVSRKEVSFGTDRTYEVRIEPVRLEDQGPVVILADLHDITERKELDAMKVDFASIAAHELRTPITTITGYLSLLEEELLSTLDNDHATFLHRAIESTKRLNSTVESLLAVTRVEKGQSAVHMESVDLIQQAQETIDEMELYAAEKQQSLSLQVVDTQIPRVVADSLKVKEILVNLIGNAIKYTQSKGAIEISLDQTNEYVQVHVKDNGPGITEKTQKFLFRKFSRGDNPLTEQTQGVGLGLYLVKSLVELQGGSIWVNSSAGKGTTFSFRLPKEHNYLHEKT
jgi:two-component system sensor histidine kinase ResE